MECVKSSIISTPRDESNERHECVLVSAVQDKRVYPAQAFAAAHTERGFSIPVAFKGNGPEEAGGDDRRAGLFGSPDWLLNLRIHR